MTTVLRYLLCLASVTEIHLKYGWKVIPMSDKKNVTENSTTSQFEEHGTDYTDEEYKFFQMTDLDVEEVKHNNHQESQVVHHAEHGKDYTDEEYKNLQMTDLDVDVKGSKHTNNTNLQQMEVDVEAEKKNITAAEKGEQMDSISNVSNNGQNIPDLQPSHLEEKSKNESGKDTDTDGEYRNLQMTDLDTEMEGVLNPADRMAFVYEDKLGLFNSLEAHLSKI